MYGGITQSEGVISSEEIPDFLQALSYQLQLVELIIFR